MSVLMVLSAALLAEGTALKTVGEWMKDGDPTEAPSASAVAAAAAARAGAESRELPATRRKLFLALGSSAVLLHPRFESRASMQSRV